VTGLDSLEQNILQISSENQHGFPAFPLYLSYNIPIDSSGFYEPAHLEAKGTWFQITADKSRLKHSKYLSALYRKIPEIFSLPIDENIIQLNIPYQAAMDNQYILETFFNISMSDFVYIQRDTEMRVSSGDGLFSAHFTPSSMYNDIITRISVLPDSQNIYKTDPLYQKIGKIYDLEPFDEPVNSGVRITLRSPEAAGHPNGLALYYWDTKKGWLYIPSDTDSINRSYSARVTSLEKFTLIQDTIPPVLYPLAVTRGTVIQSPDRNLKFFLKDEMSGIYREKQIQAEINGKWHFCEFDPEEDTVQLDIPENARLPVEIKIEAVDNLGNKTSKVFTLE
jgi:hypothetical protein